MSAAYWCDLAAWVSVFAVPVAVGAALGALSNWLQRRERAK